MSILSVENLSLKIGSESILNNISFKLVRAVFWP